MKILRIKDVISMTRIARSTLYKMIAANQFPKAISLGGRSVGWIEEEIDQWLQNKIAARNMRLAEQAAKQ